MVRKERIAIVIHIQHCLDVLNEVELDAVASLVAAAKEDLQVKRNKLSRELQKLTEHRVDVTA